MVLAVFLTVFPLQAAQADIQGISECDEARQIMGLCGENTGNGITLEGRETGTSGGTDGGGSSDPGASGGGAPTPQEICLATPGPPSAFCRSLTPVGVPVGQPSPATPGWSVTMSDLARFVPATATVVGEPDNVAVVGLPANFVSSAATETIPGSVLGRALTIRFTPVSYAFDYGDGARRTSTTPGAAWDASGQPQFTPTDTSHVYRKPGIFTVTATVTYSADIDLGAGWIPINGRLTGPPASQQIRVVKAYTALVEGTCMERPRAPGC
ncbi:hypothetical protein [uncultured Microbacterium sp.]|uniref:hypothetical protein n=1 Tax=uncultured Microbacterium sp. TaxID=191216 RepID=UPI0025EEBBA1|nr:hypothetical protein [uncultured Microbacterium sp.]